MSILSKLKIAHRVMVLGVLAVSGIAVIAGILLAQRQFEAASRETGYRLAARGHPAGLDAWTLRNSS